MGRTTRIWWLLASALIVLAGACTSASDAGGSDAETSGVADSSEEAGSADVDESQQPATTPGSFPSGRGPSGAQDAVAEEDSADQAGALTGGDDVSGPSGGESGLVPAGLTAVDYGRDIIFTAQLEVEAVDVGSATLTAVTTVQSLGGFVFGQQTTSRPTPITTLVFKVPPAQFQAALTGLGDVGFVRSQQISADDVTEQVVDLESRIITAEASVNRLRALLESATDLSSIAQLEAELLRRETDLELLRGQLRTIQDQVSLSTITVAISEKVPGPAIELIETFVAGGDSDGTFACPGTAELSIVEDEPLTVCFAVANIGDTHLDHIVVSDVAFDLEHRDLALVSGDVEAPLAPGDQLVFAAEVEATGSRAAAGRVRATPVDADGNELALALAIDGAEARLVVEPDESLPGFGSGLKAGWAVTLRAVSALVVAVGFLLPFVWVVPLLWFLRRFAGRRFPRPTTIAPTQPEGE